MSTKFELSRLFGLVLFLMIMSIPSSLWAGLNDKKAIADAKGKYKGTWANTTSFNDGTSFPTEFPPGNPAIAGSLRLSGNPKKISFTTPAGLHAGGPLTVTANVKITKTIVRRGGKLIIHKGKGTQDLTAFFAAGADMTGKGKAKLTARGKKFKAKGSFSGSDTTPPAGFTAVGTSGTFTGKGG